MPSMRKIVLTFGLLSGLVLSAMMVLTQPFQDRIGYGIAGMVVGYATMVAASLLVYFGVRRYRDTTAGGRVSFGRAFAVGMLIVAVSSACYVATWEVIYFNFKPDFLVKYHAHQLEQERAKGATPAQLAALQARMARDEASYDNPLVNSAYTFLEPLPVGLLAALVSAAALRRRTTPDRLPALAEPV